MGKHLITHGDADGLVSAYQWINANGLHRVYTGPKKNVWLVNELADEIPPNSEVVVLDLNSEQNREGLEILARKGCHLTYVDHHATFEGIEGLVHKVHIDEDPEFNTSTILNDMFRDKFLQWAIVGAYGDVKIKKAMELGSRYLISTAHLDALKDIGTVLNYNSEALVADPEEVLKEMIQHEFPLEFADSELYGLIKKKYLEDKARLGDISPSVSFANVDIYFLPKESRGMTGGFLNGLKEERYDRVHVAVVPSEDETFYFVDIRTPGRPTGSDLGRLFGGDGRVDAGGGRIPARDDPVQYVADTLKASGYF